MANEELEQLKLEADSLGIAYSGNIGAKKLQEKIDEFYAAEAKTATITSEKSESTEKEVKDARVDVKKEARRIIREQENANSQSIVVKITMVDKREASTATDAYFNNGNYAMRVPLDVWVEMPKILVVMAEEAQALIHKETDRGAVPSMAKKYVVEYKRD